MRTHLKIIFFLLTAVLGGSVCVMASSSSFTEANAKYAAGDFKTAAALYQQIVDSKQATAAVHYNLANADLRLGKKGLALLNYERAFKVSPRDKDLLWNMTILKNTLPDRTEGSQANLVVMFLDKISDLLTIDEISLILAAALGLLALLAAIRFFSVASKAWTSPLQFLIWMLILAATILFAFKWTQVKEPRVVVLESEIYAHYGPSDKETKAFLLHEGAEAKVMDESKSWIYIVLDNKETGWIPKESCEII